jgi:hypothetical protein
VAKKLNKLKRQTNSAQWNIIGVQNRTSERKNNCVPVPVTSQQYLEAYTNGRLRVRVREGGRGKADHSAFFLTSERAPSIAVSYEAVIVLIGSVSLSCSFFFVLVFRDATAL